MTKILKTRYKAFKKTGVRFNARRAKIRLTLNKLNLRLWDNLEFKKNHKKSRHPKFNDTLWRLTFKNKQEIKAFYGGISESTFQKFNKKNKLGWMTSSSISEGNSKKTMLVNIFETRLDVIIFKLHWAMSIYHAKQLISHGHIQVNGRKVKIPSYILKPNDKVQVFCNPESRKLIKKSLKNKLSRINSIIEIIYFKRIPFYLGGIGNLKDKIEYWLFLPLSLEVDYYTMTATLIFKNENERMTMYHPLRPFRTI